MSLLETARLRLRPFVMEDLEDCLAMDLDPAVHKYIFLDGPPDPAERREGIRERVASGWPEVGANWSVEWKDRPGFLGWCGVFPLEDSGLMEVGYRFIQKAWGQGVGTETAAAALHHGFTVLDFDPIVAVTHPENQGSQRVLEKIGLKPEGLARHYGLDLSFFRLARADYPGKAGT